MLERAKLDYEDQKVTATKSLCAPGLALEIVP